MICTDTELIAAVRAVSVACHGRAGCGVLAHDVGATVYEASRDASRPYSQPDLDATRKSVTRALARLARSGAISRGQDRCGAFYRAMEPVETTRD
jgi:hypothetical protein